MRKHLSRLLPLLALTTPLCFQFVPWTPGSHSFEAVASDKPLVARQNDSPVRIAVYSGEGAFFRSIKASTKMFQWMGAQVERIYPQEIIEGKLNAFDILYMTGGWAVPYNRDLSGQGFENIRSFLRAGGGYIGTCAGAFFAADYIFWEGARYEYLLDIFPGYAKGSIHDIVPWPQHSMCRINISEHTHPITVREPSSLTSMYYGGPWFYVPPEAAIDVLATYDVNGKPAMVAYPRGKGKIFLTGVHTEFEEGSDRDGVLWDDDLHDPDSEWPLMLETVRWIVAGH